MSNSEYSLTSISKSWNELFGIATLWLVLFHSPGISFDHISGIAYCIPVFLLTLILAIGLYNVTETIVAVFFSDQKE